MWLGVTLVGLGVPRGADGRADGRAGGRGRMGGQDRRAGKPEPVPEPPKRVDSSVSYATEMCSHCRHATGTADWRQDSVFPVTEKATSLFCSKIVQ